MGALKPTEKNFSTVRSKKKKKNDGMACYLKNTMLTGERTLKCFYLVSFKLEMSNLKKGIIAQDSWEDSKKGTAPL